ncbi:MAG TPA: hypothetical protein VEQ60_28135, partial [Longimicrobium sp.]|nr:hypothetical protein [Longimicrobium sp.]
MLHRRHVSFAAALVLIVACTRDSDSPLGPGDAGAPGGPGLGIYDAAHNSGRAGFYFLPPLVKQPSFTGTFDASLLPQVQMQVCELSGTACVAGPPVASWTASGGTGGAVVTVDPVAQRYQVAWDTNLSSLNVLKFYRIRVLVSGIELGYADLDPVSSGSELKNVNTDEYIALKDGRTL